MHKPLRTSFDLTDLRFALAAMRFSASFIAFSSFSLRLRSSFSFSFSIFWLLRAAFFSSAVIAFEEASGDLGASGTACSA